MQRAWANVRIIHPYPASIVVVMSLCLVAIAHRGNPGGLLLARAAIVVLLSQTAVGSLNDYVDRHSDALGQPTKPIGAGEVSPRFALCVCIVAALLLIPAALTFGGWSLLLVVVGTGAGVAYDLWLKPTVWSVLPYHVGFLSLVTWIWAVAGRLTPQLFALYPFALGLLLVAHLAQSLPDVETDRSTGNYGLAARLGAGMCTRIIVVIYAASVCAAVVVAILSRSPVGFWLACSGATVLIPMWLTRRRTVVDRLARLRLFRLVAPGIALVAGSVLLSIPPP